MSAIVKSEEDLVCQARKCQDKNCCKGNFHCPLCPPKFFTPNRIYKVKRHLKSSHWKRRIAAPDGDFSVICHLDHKVGAHFHCPGCKKIISKKCNLIHHLNICSVYINESEHPLGYDHGNGITEITMEQLPKTPEPGHYYDTRTVTERKGKKLCSECGKVVSSSWFSRHQKLHTSTSPGISSNRHHHTVIVDAKNGLYTSSISIKGRQIPIHAKKITLEDDSAISQCEHKTCEELKETAIRGGNLSYECPHLLSIQYAIHGNTFTFTNETLLEMKQRGLITDDSFDEIRKLLSKATMEQVPFVVVLPYPDHVSARYTHMSVFSGEKNCWSVFERTIVTMDSQTNSVTCRCTRRSRKTCIHQIVGKLYMFCEQWLDSNLISTIGDVSTNPILTEPVGKLGPLKLD